MGRMLILLLALVFLPQKQAASPQQAYVEQYAALAVSEMQRTGVPASITLAQGIVESDAGRSPLAVHANNHFGIKCHNDWTGGEYHKDDDREQECFRSYASVEESFRAHSDFLRERPRYAGLFELEQTDYKGWARGLRKAGYATDPGYASKLIRIIEEYGLDQYDRMPSVPSPPVVRDTIPAPAPPPAPVKEKRDSVRYSERIILPI